MKRWLYTLLLALFATAAYGQSTSVSATITDSDGIVWFGGTYSISFVPTPGIPGPYLWNGIPMTDAQKGPYTGTLNGSGAFTVSLPDNKTISPAGTQWLFAICPQASAVCTQIRTPVTGASQSFTTQFSAAAIAPRFPAQGVGFYGYSNVEINQIPVPGGSYYNVTTACTQVWSGTAFGCVSGSGTFSGSLANMQIAVGSGVNTIAGYNNFTFNPGTNTEFVPFLDSPSINNIVFVDGTTYAKSAAGVNAAFASCSGPCEVFVTYPGTYSDALISVPSSDALRFAPGVFVHAGIRCASSGTSANGGCAIIGDGIGKTILRTGNSANVDGIASANYSEFSTKEISTATRSANTVTATCTSTCGFGIGDMVQVEFLQPGSFNGMVTVTSSSGTQFSYANIGSNQSTTSHGFASTDYGTYQFIVQDLTVDGNYLNNTSGNCMSLAGPYPVLVNVEIGNCAAEGLETSFGESPANFLGNSQVFPTLSNVNIHNANFEGVFDKGPHDAVWTNLEVAFSAQTGGAACINVWRSVKWQGGEAFLCANHYGTLVTRGGNAQLTNIQSESIGFLAVTGWNAPSPNMGSAVSIYANGNGQPALEFDSYDNVFDGWLENTLNTEPLLYINGGAVIGNFDILFSQQNAPWVNFSNAARASSQLHIWGVNACPMVGCITGNFNRLDDVWLMANGAIQFNQTSNFTALETFNAGIESDQTWDMLPGLSNNTIGSTVTNNTGTDDGTLHMNGPSIECSGANRCGIGLTIGNGSGPTSSNFEIGADISNCHAVCLAIQPVDIASQAITYLAAATNTSSFIAASNPGGLFLNIDNEGNIVDRPLAGTGVRQVCASAIGQLVIASCSAGTGNVSVVGTPTAGQIAQWVTPTSIQGITLVTGANGGTGVNNGSNTITLGGNLATVGAFNSTFNITGPTNVTFPTSGTLVTNTVTTLPNLALPLNQLISAVGADTLANGDNPFVMNYATTTSGRVGVTFGETTASVAAGTPYEFKVSTLAGSTASPEAITNSLTGSQTLCTVCVFPTWNTTGVVDAGIFENVTNTASGASSKLMDLQIGGASKFYVDKTGVANLPSGGVFSWNGDTGLSRCSANIVCFGNATPGDFTATIHSANAEFGTPPTSINLATAHGGTAYFENTNTGFTPTVGECYVRADSTLNDLVKSCNGNAESVIGSGAGSGTVNSGTQYQLGYYATTGTAISGDPNITTDASNNIHVGGQYVDLNGGIAAYGGTFGTGYAIGGVEGTGPTCKSGWDLVWFDSTAHQPMNCDNNGAVEPLYTTLGASNVTAQATSQGSTNILASTPAAGSYSIRYYVGQSTACTTGTNAVAFTFGWTDASTSRTFTTTTLTLAATLGVGGYLSGIIPLYSAASSAITYSSTVTGTCLTGTSKYDIHVSVERTQ